MTIDQKRPLSEVKFIRRIICTCTNLALQFHLRSVTELLEAEKNIIQAA